MNNTNRVITCGIGFVKAPEFEEIPRMTQSELDNAVRNGRNLIAKLQAYVDATCAEIERRDKKDN